MQLNPMLVYSEINPIVVNRTYSQVRVDRIVAIE